MADFLAQRSLAAAVERAEHGTRACYVGQRCRCEPCRRANADYYRQRQAKRDELAAEVDIVPTGPAGRRRRGGRRIRTCPGANGSPCVQGRGGAWLREGGNVCKLCIERATVWNGLVPADRVRQHLQSLSAQGVGYKSVADAASVARSLLGGIIRGERTQLRAQSERAILAVDAGALADGQSIDAGPTWKLVEQLQARGFSKSELAHLLGYKAGALQLSPERVLAANAAAVERLWRRVERGDLAPTSRFESSDEAWAALDTFLEAGLAAKWLTKRLGFTVTPHKRSPRILKENAAKVRALVAEAEQLRREGGDSPEPWENGRNKLNEAFGFDGGWGFDLRTSKKAAKREAQELKRLAKTGRAA